MNVLFLTPSYSPMIGGGEYYAQALAEELGRRGHHITVVTSMIARQSHFWVGCAGQPPCVGQVPGQWPHVIRLPVRPALFGRPGQLGLRKMMTLLANLEQFALPLLMRSSRHFPRMTGLDKILHALPLPDLVHSFNLSWEHGIIAGHLFSGEQKIPHVITPFLHMETASRHSVWRNNAMPHQRVALSSAARVLALSDVERQGLLRLGVARERIHLVGAAVQPLEQVPATVTTRVSVEDRLPLALFVGRADRDKGALLAMRALAKVHRAGIQCRMVLVGQPSAAVRRLYRRLEHQGVPIRLLGPVSEHTKHELLSQCRVLLLPSRVESFGLVLLEAWQHGKPVIAARAGGPLSLVRHGQDGLLVPWGDVAALSAALTSLLADPALAESMGRAGKQRAASSFSWPEVALRVEAAYQAALMRQDPCKDGKE